VTCVVLHPVPHITDYFGDGQLLALVINVINNWKNQTNDTQKTNNKNKLPRHRHTSM